MKSYILMSLSPSFSFASKTTNGKIRLIHREQYGNEKRNENKKPGRGLGIKKRNETIRKIHFFSLFLFSSLSHCRRGSIRCRRRERPSSGPCHHHHHRSRGRYARTRMRIRIRRGQEEGVRAEGGSGFDLLRAAAVAGFVAVVVVAGDSRRPLLPPRERKPGSQRRAGTTYDDL